MSFRDEADCASASEMGEPGPETAIYDDPQEMPDSEIMERRAQTLAQERADTGEYARALTERFQQGRVA